MSLYYVNKNVQSSGDHEVHKHGCSRMPLTENRIYLGDFSSCTPAVKKAKEYYSTADGCFYCSTACHSS